MKCPLSVFFWWRPADTARTRAEAQADALAEAEAAFEVGEPILRWTQESARAYHPSAQDKTQCQDCRDIRSSILGVLGISCGAPGCQNSEHMLDRLFDLIEHQYPSKGI